MAWTVWCIWDVCVSVQLSQHGHSDNELYSVSFSVLVSCDFIVEALSIKSKQAEKLSCMLKVGEIILIIKCSKYSEPLI